MRAWQRIGILAADVGPVEDVAARLKAVLDPMFDLAIGEVSLAELLRQQVELQREYGARAARELVLVSKQLMYFERYAKELAPAYNMARDLFLLQNVFPEDVAAACAERGVTLPDDDGPTSPPSRAEASTARLCPSPRTGCGRRQSQIEGGRAGGSRWTTTSSWTARVSATYSRRRPRAVPPAIAGGLDDHDGVELEALGLGRVERRDLAPVASGRPASAASRRPQAVGHDDRHRGVLGRELGHRGRAHLVASAASSPTLTTHRRPAAGPHRPASA